MANVTIGPPGSGALPTASTIDPIQDYLPIYTASATATQGINRNTLLNIASQPTGNTDTQILTNKTLTSPTINGATLSGTLSGTYTIGGTPTFPSGVTQNTAMQILTNKTLTSPTINSPTITNASITADSITGYTTSNTGSIYGISVSGGQITNAALANGTIGSAQIATNGVGGSNLATSAIYLGSAQQTASQTTTSTTYVAVPGLSVTVTVPAGGRKVKVTLQVRDFSPNSANAALMGLFRGTVAGTQIGEIKNGYGATGYQTGGTLIAIDSPSAGSVTYIAAFLVTGGTVTIDAGSGAPMLLLVEAI